MLLVALLLMFALATPQTSAQESIVRDVYIFNSNEDEQRIVVAAVVTKLDPTLLYQFNFDTNRDGIEDRVVQAYVRNEGAKHVATVTGPSVPERTGSTTQGVKAQSVTGDVSTASSPQVLAERGTTIRAFVGRRDDPSSDKEQTGKNVDLIAVDLALQEILAEHKPDFDFWVSVYRRDS